MIPEDINAIALLDELNRLGWNDYKIEAACGFSSGYAAKIRSGDVKNPSYHHSAKLFNFLERERALRVEEVVCRGR